MVILGCKSKEIFLICQSKYKKNILKHTVLFCRSSCKSPVRDKYIGEKYEILALPQSFWIVSTIFFIDILKPK
jgi:hypothetical protein